MQGLQRDASWGENRARPMGGACQKHRAALHWGEGRLAKCPWPCLCLVGRSGRAKQSSHVPWLHRESSVASFSSLIYPVFSCLFLLPCIEAQLFLYACKNNTPLSHGLALGVCCVCLHLLFLLSTLPALQPQQGTRFLLPVVFLFFLEFISVSKCTMLFLITEELASSWKFSGCSQLRKPENSVSLGLKASSFFIWCALSLCPTPWLCHLPQRCILW